MPFREHEPIAIGIAQTLDFELIPEKAHENFDNRKRRADVAGIGGFRAFYNDPPNVFGYTCSVHAIPPEGAQQAKN
jgi:hypothetical protein